MKKFLSVMLMIVMAMSIAVAAVGCGGNEPTYSSEDTFTGALSKEGYESEAKAVEMFLASEISGEAVKAELVGFEKKSDLSQEQIKELNTEDVLNEDDEIVSAQVVEVKYNKKEVEVSNTASQEDEYSVFTVYIIEISPSGKTVHEFRYYVPKAANGDVLTKSYYEDVLDPSKYVNCTQEYSNNTSVDMGGMTMNTNINYTIKVADDKAFLSMHLPNLTGAGLDAAYMDLLGYFEYSEGNFVIWASQDNGTTYIKSQVNTFAPYGITDMKSFATMCMPKLDYSYFEKTDFGFKIQDGFVGKYISKSLAQMGYATDINAELLFYVKEGRIEKMVANVNGTIGGVKYTGHEELVYSAFGTTTVTRPAAIKEEDDTQA